MDVNITYFTSVLSQNLACITKLAVRSRESVASMGIGVIMNCNEHNSYACTFDNIQLKLYKIYNAET